MNFIIFAFYLAFPDGRRVGKFLAFSTDDHSHTRNFAETRQKVRLMKYNSYISCHSIFSSVKCEEITPLQSRPKQLERFADFYTLSLLLTHPPSNNVESRRIFATFGVNLEHASLDQPFLPTNQHWFGGRKGGRREREDSPELLKMLWSFSKITFC